MIYKNQITIDSKLGSITNDLFLIHSEGSKNLVVIFPGGDNSTDIPVLHYARKGALLTGCDVLSMEYGTNIGLAALDKSEIIKTIIDEGYNVIQKCLIKIMRKYFL